MLLVVADKRERSGDCERCRTEADGGPQGRDWVDMLHLSRGISQSADEGKSSSVALCLMRSPCIGYCKLVNHCLRINYYSELCEL